jgi:integrase
MLRVSATRNNPDEINSVSPSLSQSKRKKASKGTVVVQVFKECLRLVWSYLGKRYYLYIGLPDSKINRTVAEQKARQIEGDMATGNFDPTLKKYKLESPQKSVYISLTELFNRFMVEKAKVVTPKTMEKYEATLGYLNRYFDDEAAQFIDLVRVEDFAQHLNDRGLSPVQCKRRLEKLKACWNWAIEKQLITTGNPWNDVIERIQIPPKQMPKPFTREEIGAIIQAFRGDRYYHYYADYVEFLLGTGCRTGEAIGLRWKHLCDDCSTVWIGEIISRRVNRPVKRNRARTITLTPKLQAMLLARRDADFNPNDLVFVSPNGKAIDDHNFRNRAWKTILTRLGIDYRKPYTTRHTLISHALDTGMNPVVVAQLTGHDVKTLYENYAGVVNSRPRLPEI